MRAFGLWLALACAGCVSSTDELRGLSEQAPLDRAVLVTGGAFTAATQGADGTFRADPVGTGEANAATKGADEALAFASIVDVLQRGGVFRRVVADDDEAHRRRFRELLVRGGSEAELLPLLRAARTAGFDLVLLVEDLQDGPIENHGTNGRWPITFATWVLLGVGMFIPDRTFESRATLRVSLREVQTGNLVHELLLAAGPIELSLVERTDFLGLVESIIVPPFLVGDDRAAVQSAVQETTRRRLLLSLARDLKSEAARRLIQERAAARIELVVDGAGARVVVESRESLGTVRLASSAGAIEPAAADAFAATLLASQAQDGDRFRYEAPLPRVDASLVQVLVGTLRGAVASATFAPGGGR